MAIGKNEVVWIVAVPSKEVIGRREGWPELIGSALLVSPPLKDGSHEQVSPSGFESQRFRWENKMSLNELTVANILNSECLRKTVSDDLPYEQSRFRSQLLMNQQNINTT